VSHDGGQNFVELLAADVSASSGGWREMVLPLGDLLPFTATMQLRFVAMDQTESVVESLVDDLVIEAIVGPATLTIWSSGALGTTARFGRRGLSGQFGLLLIAPRTGDVPIPGVGGRLLLDPIGLSILDTTAFGQNGYRPLDLALPNQPDLRGATFYFQQLTGSSLQDLHLGNRASLRLR
jgi:hypothetical protein